VKKFFVKAFRNPRFLQDGKQCGSNRIKCIDPNLVNTLWRWCDVFNASLVFSNKKSLHQKSDLVNIAARTNVDATFQDQFHFAFDCLLLV